MRYSCSAKCSDHEIKCILLFYSCKKCINIWEKFFPKFKINSEILSLDLSGYVLYRDAYRITTVFPIHTPTYNWLGEIRLFSSFIGEKLQHTNITNMIIICEFRIPPCPCLITSHLPISCIYLSMHFICQRWCSI